MNPGKPQDQLLSRVLSGPLTPELSAELDAWLSEDPAHPELLAQFILLEDMLVAARKESAATSVLELLLEMEENAEPILVTQPDPPLSERVFALTQQNNVKWFALAAGILLCISAGLWGLSVLFTGQSDQPAPLAGDNNTTNESTEPGRVGPVSTNVVATLTAEHDAIWDRRPAKHLNAGDRFTLTHGFAEITTNDGAVAILEAPATIELTDNDNALHLHTGKLVGICESESSKGLLVRTPHMDIIDIGTRFGVQVDKNLTRTHVLSGEIEVRPAHAEQDVLPKRLSAGDSAKAQAGSSAIKKDRALGLSFVQELPAPDTTPRIQGAARFEHALPIRLKSNQAESDDIVIFLEQSGTRLTSDVQVTIDQPGRYASYINRQSALPKGTKVHTYLVQYDPPGNLAGAPRQRATVVFDRPVLGIIATDEQMSKANAILGIDGVSYASPPSSLTDASEYSTGLEDIDGEAVNSVGDLLVLSEDRMTLWLDLKAGRHSDQIRVLVQAEGE